MTNKFCDSPIHKVLSLALAFIIFFCFFLSSFASADSYYPEVVVGYQDGDTFRDIIAVVLDSWGINFSRDSNTPGSLASDMDSLLQDFYASQGVLAAEFWRKCKVGVDKLGQLLLDNTTAGRIIQFARWLINKYNLDSNTSVDISRHSFVPVVPIDANSIYNADFIGNYYYTSDSHTDYLVNYLGTTYSGVIAVYYYSQDGVSLGGRIFASLQPSSISNVYYNPSSGTFGNVTSVSINQPDPFGYYYQFAQYANDRYFVGPGTDSFVFSSYEEAVRQIFALLNATPFYVSTLNVSIPEIADDEGLVVTIPDSEWGNSLFDVLNLIERLIALYDTTQLEIISIVDTLENIIANLQTEVSVNNIPGGVVLDYNNYDIPLEDDWGLFNIFFNTGGDEITLLRPWSELKAIIYGFPAPVLSFFALVVLFIIAYGFIRMGRDSH